MFLTETSRIQICPLAIEFSKNEKRKKKGSNIFFLINNIRILLIIERLPNGVHWGCTMGAQIKKQKNNGQETKKRKNKKNEKNHTPFKESV